jgi:hypothetical protein
MLATSATNRTRIAMAVIALAATALVGARPARSGCEVVLIGNANAPIDLVDEMGYDVDLASGSGFVDGDLNDEAHRLVIAGVALGRQNVLLQQYLERPALAGWIQRARTNDAVAPPAQCGWTPGADATGDCSPPFIGPTQVAAAGNLAGLPAGTPLITCGGALTFDLAPGMIADIVLEDGRATAWHCEPTPNGRFVMMQSALLDANTTPEYEAMWRAWIEWAAHGPASDEPCPSPCTASNEELRLQIETLATALALVSEQNCELIRLVTTPEGQRETDFCGGHDHRGGPARPRR